MNNPVIKDLIKLNLLKKNRLKIIALKVRNGSTKVFQEKNSKIIVLEKNLIKKNYYWKYYKNFNIKFNKSKKFTFEKIEKNFIKLVKNNEEERRLSLIKNIEKRLEILKTLMVITLLQKKLEKLSNLWI